MATKTASLNTKLDFDEKSEFTRNAEALGISPSAAVKIFVRKFNECGGFPFEVRRSDRGSSTVTLSASQFDAFVRALEKPVPDEAKELLKRDYPWAD